MERYLKRLILLLLSVVFLSGCDSPVDAEDGTEAGAETSGGLPDVWKDPDDITFENLGNFWVEYIPVSHGVDEVIHFSDPGLEARVRLWVDKPEGDLYRSDVWDIHYIDVGIRAEGESFLFLKEPLQGTGFRLVSDYVESEKKIVGKEVPGIRNLCDLAYFESLQIFRIGGHLERIEKISGVEKCENLSFFQLGENGGRAPEDLEVIAEMNNLVWLSLNSVENMDLALVQDLEKLEVLDIGRSSFLSLEPVAGMPLKVFMIGCDINTHDLVDVDFAPLAELKELRRLDLCCVDSFTLEDVSYLKGLEHLKMLNLTGAKLQKEVKAVREELPGVSVRVLTFP